MSQLAIDRDFVHDLCRLERGVQERIADIFDKFAHDTHAGLHLEKIQGAKDARLRSIRVTRFYRAVVLAPESGEVYTLLKVLPHDDAYAWAQRRSATVNSATGRIEIRDSVAIEDTLPGLSRRAETTPERLFDHVKDGQLRSLGIDDQTLAYARVLTDQVQLDAAKPFLPQIQWDVLCGLAAGLSPEEVWTELGAAITAEPVDTDDIDAAVLRSSDRMVFVEGPEELMAILEHPFALWRVYLHPVQRAVVEASYAGPARVSGGPGTGKTVVALHRAQHLARDACGAVLVTTFTSTLADSLAAGIDLLVDDESVAGRIDVTHLDRLAHRVFREVHGAPKMLRDGEEKQLWKDIAARLELPFNETFLAEEWREVVLGQRVASAGEYLAAKRTGRGRGLGRRQRAQVWQAIWEFQQALRERGAWTHETIRAEATRILERRGDKPYRHIVVDEAQDLSPEQWRLVRAAADEGPDDLFMAGDTHQRIYDNRVSLRDVGIHVTGRASKLRLNYRTTAEILGWSLGLLRGEAIDDMDGALDSIADCRSELRGRPPTLSGHATKDAELRHLAATVRSWLDAGIDAGEIGLAARANWLVAEIVELLRAESVPVHLLTSGQPVEDAVSVGTMHRMKGLEFRCLAVVGVGDQQVPASAAVTSAVDDEATHTRDLQRERCLLFVACTRAREQLAVSWHGQPSPFLSAVT